MKRLHLELLRHEKTDQKRKPLTTIFLNPFFFFLVCNADEEDGSFPAAELALSSDLEAQEEEDSSAAERPWTQAEIDADKVAHGFPFWFVRKGLVERTSRVSDERGMFVRYECRNKAQAKRERKVVKEEPATAAEEERALEEVEEASCPATAYQPVDYKTEVPILDQRVEFLHDHNHDVSKKPLRQREAKKTHDPAIVKEIEERLQTFRQSKNKSVVFFQLTLMAIFAAPAVVLEQMQAESKAVSQKLVKAVQRDVRAQELTLHEQLDASAFVLNSATRWLGFPGPFIVMGDRELLKEVRGRICHLYADGTRTITEQGTQLIAIKGDDPVHGLVVLAYAITRSHAGHEHWRFLGDTLHNMGFEDSENLRIHLDFEAAEQLGLREVFKTARIQGCFFHFIQACRKNLNSMWPAFHSNSKIWKEVCSFSFTIPISIFRFLADPKNFVEHL